MNKLLWKLPKKLRPLISRLVHGKALVRVSDLQGRYPTRYFWTRFWWMWLELRYADFDIDSYGMPIRWLGPPDSILAIHTTAVDWWTNLKTAGFFPPTEQVGASGGWTFWRRKV